MSDFESDIVARQLLWHAREGWNPATTQVREET